MLRRFGNTPASWSRRRLAATWLEAAASVLWSHLLIVLTVVWIFAPRDGANPVIAYWGMVIAFVDLSQALIGVLLDRRYDTRIWRSVLWLPLYPLIYWVLLSAAAVRGTLPGALRRPSGPVTWHIPRTRQETGTN
ncbi:hypothetical protein OJ998_04125 [Solirubrobacter taibaiensis]|nr:hypothetical protein [Solirubrobacter taibaiensis]